MDLPAPATTSLSQPAEPPQPGQPRSRRLPYLDGIRAFAVLAVVLYHGGVSWVGGGLLGVDVFFVLSGFLITSLLCTEFATRATIGLKRFWAARARRLLPALFILLLGVAAYAFFFSSSVDVTSVRGDALSTLFYVANWHFVLSDQGYFVQSASPSPLLHTWSLAVEEQYYLIWPLVALVVLRRWGRRGLATVAIIGALASAVLMVCLFHIGISADRLYYGTDTRAQALLVGSFLGVVAAGRRWRVVDRRWAHTERGRTTGTVLAVVGTVGLLWAWHAFQGQSPFLYDGGFLLVAVFAATVIATVTSWPHGALAKFLSLRPFVFLGRISYGVYLYHWPLFLAIDHAHTGLEGLDLLVVRLLATFAVAVLSWRLVEEPIRQRRLLTTTRQAGIATAAGAVTIVVVLVLATIPPPAQAPPSVLRASGRAVMPPAEVQALRSAHAFTTKPIRFMFTGDSLAATAAKGLAVDAKAQYGVKVIDKALLGCGLELGPMRLDGITSIATRTENCGSWQKGWPVFVNETRPQVVGLLLGRFELADYRFHGKWVHLGDAGWDAHVEHQLDQVVRIFFSHGARVVLFTFPYIDPPVEQANGDPYPQDSPSRVNAWNKLLLEAAARYPRHVTVINLNHVLDPDGHYVNSIDGVDVRTSDGIHITTPGGEWLRPRVLPKIAQLGLQARATQHS